MRPENRALLGPRDVVLASHPGSGTSWIATLLVQLGVFYASGHNELLADRTSQRTGAWVDDERQALAPAVRGPDGGPVLGARAQRRHLVALDRRDRDHPTYREPCRVIQTNQAALGWKPPTRVLLLVRDGRDAVLSLYHSLCAFSGLEASLAEFLAGRARPGPTPAMAWGASVLSWLGAMPRERLHVVRFETCRERPLEELTDLLAFLGVERETDELRQAIEASSYARMRQVEDAAIERDGERIGRGRVMRRGLVGEWREVYTPEMLATFSGLPRRALEAFGYPTGSLPHEGRRA